MVEAVRSKLPQIEDLCRKHGVRRLFLIGSALGVGFDAARSDVDFLVEFESHDRSGPASRYFDLLEDLQRLLNRRVDLIERHCVENPYVRSALEGSKVPLYAAA